MPRPPRGPPAPAAAPRVAGGTRVELILWLQSRLPIAPCHGQPAFLDQGACFAPPPAWDAASLLVSAFAPELPLVCELRTHLACCLAQQVRDTLAQGAPRRWMWRSTASAILLETAGIAELYMEHPDRARRLVALARISARLEGTPFLASWQAGQGFFARGLLFPARFTRDDFPDLGFVRTDGALGHALDALHNAYRASGWNADPRNRVYRPSSDGVVYDGAVRMDSCPAHDGELRGTCAYCLSVLAITGQLGDRPWPEWGRDAPFLPGWLAWEHAGTLEMVADSDHEPDPRELVHGGAIPPRGDNRRAGPAALEAQPDGPVDGNSTASSSVLPWTPDTASSTAPDATSSIIRHVDGLPAGWIAAEELATGRFYYFQAGNLSVVQWVVPIAPAP